MSKQTDPDLVDEAMLDSDDADFPADDWSLDEFDDAADLASLSSAWMGANDRFE